MAGDPHTRNRILLTAREQFFAHGFMKVTMDELAGLLGMSKKTLYKNFPSKDRLAEAVLERHIITAMTRYKEIMNSTLDYTEKLSNTLCLFGKTFTQMGKRYQEELRFHRPDLWQRIEELRSRTVFADFMIFLDSGIKQSIIRADVHREALLIAYVGALQGVLDSNVLFNNSFSVSEAFASITQMFLDGMLTESAKRDIRIRHEHTTQPTQRASL